MGGLLKALDYAKELVQEVLEPGEVAVDATAGNGHDTVFLARLVGPQGRVWAFDIQREALERVRQRLQRENLAQRVTLLLKGHENMASYVKRPVGAIMFNLGYLPGGDHSIITSPETTVVAVRAGLSLLRVGGIMTLVVYTGHPGGMAESEALVEFCTNLPQENFQVLQYRFLNQQNFPPYLLAIAKLRD